MLVIAIVATVVTERVVEPRLGPYQPESTTPAETGKATDGDELSPGCGSADRAGSLPGRRFTPQRDYTDDGLSALCGHRRPALSEKRHPRDDCGAYAALFARYPDRLPSVGAWS